MDILLLILSITTIRFAYNRRFCMKKVGAIFLLIMIIAVLSACSGEKTDTIKIGSIHPITGSMAEAGQALVNAQQIAVDEINAAGGIGGKKVELSVIDSQGSAGGASVAARKLINNGCIALTGAYTSGSAQAVSQEAERGKTPFVVTVAASADLLSRGYEYSFRIQPSVTVFSKNFVSFFNEYVKKNIKAELRTCVLIYEDSNYGAGIAEYIKEHIDETGLEIIGDISYSASTATLSSEVTRLEKLKPDLLIPIGYKNDQTILVNELLSRNVNFKSVIGVANGAFSDPDFLRSYGKKVNGYIDINYRYNPNSPNTEYLCKKYREIYGKDIPVAAIYGYESIKVIADAAERCEGDVSAQSICEALKKTSIFDHVLPQKLIEFDSSGEDLYASGVMIQIQDGSPVVLYPTEYADKNAQFLQPGE